MDLNKAGTSSAPTPPAPPLLLQMDLNKAASDGFFLNLGAVLLKLCEPFRDASSAAFWQRVDARYPHDGRLDMKEVSLRAWGEDGGRG